MRRYFFMLLLLLYACKTACAQKYNTCLQEAQGDGPKKEQCYRNYKGCLNWCANPPRRG
jgi:hypothetical protein